MQQQHGSGKTAVLVERIINKIINDKIDIDKILVVTFTNAAASEMRERILKAIDEKIEEDPENEFLQKQITLLNKANICTIHSFCLEVIRNNFFELDIPANFRIADSSEIELLKQDVIEDVFEEKYINSDKQFIKLLNVFTGYRGDEPLKEIILSLYKFISSDPFPEKWLEEKAQMYNNTDVTDFKDTIWGKILLDTFCDEVQDGIIKLNNLVKNISRFEEMEKYTKNVNSDIVNLETILKCSDSWDRCYNCINTTIWDKWPVDKKVTLDIKETAKKIRDDVRKRINSICDKILFCNSNMAIEDINKMYDILCSLKDLVKDFSSKFASSKKEKNIIDFNDIEHFALKILLKIDEDGNICKTDIAKNYEEKFDEIAIDEYQDSNLVQEYILNSISKGNNIFMVGDVKQSIYKFRQARPELFLEKYEKYPIKENQTGNELKIRLFKNFRSRDNIIKITNLVFQNIMSKEAGDINYNKEEYLYPGANFKEPEDNINYAGIAELNIIDLKEKEDFENDESTEDTEKVLDNSVIEARLVAKKIEELIDSNYMVYDKKQGYRKIKYKDIVILLRSTSVLSPIYEKELINNNIPVFSDTSSDFLESIEIQTILSVLKILDNPMQEIPLITVMRSMIGGFSDNDLINIRITSKDVNFYNAILQSRIQVEKDLANKIETFLNKLDSWRKLAKIKELDELIWQIYTETNFYHYVGLMPNGALRQANLKMLFEKAKQYEDASFKGLYNFINFIDKVHTGNSDLQSAKIIGENEDVVRIMSIHKSKGLEFPVVILSSTGKGFNLRDLNEPIIFHQDYGFGIKYIDDERKIEYNTLAKEAIRIKSHEETLSEEMRILYVALTRAKEKLIITGLSKDAKKSLDQKEELLQMYDSDNDKINPKLIKKYKKYLDFLELVYLFNKKDIDSIMKLNIYSKDDILLDKKQSLNEEKQNILESLDKTVNEDEDVKQKLNWKYEFEDSVNMIAKTSVTKLKELKNNRYIIDFEQDDNTEIDKELNLEITPNFLKEEEIISSAKKGTLMHLCMQKIDNLVEYTQKDISEFIQKLVYKNIITQKEAESININQLYNFTKSNLWNDLKLAKEIYKEKPFYLNINAKDILDVNCDDVILVQGIIDLYYFNKDDELVLVDYKTDYIKEGEEESLILKYKEQLILYKTALEKSLNKKVDKVYIYSTVLAKNIEIL